MRMMIHTDRVRTEVSEERPMTSKSRNKMRQKQEGHEPGLMGRKGVSLDEELWEDRREGSIQIARWSQMTERSPAGY